MMWRQQWALIRRHCIGLWRTPICSAIGIILWPGIITALMLVLIIKSTNSTLETKSGFIPWIAFYLKLVTSFHVYVFARILIKDKATGMKSLMLSMGLTRVNYYTAMLICIESFLLPIAISTAIFTKLLLFDDSVSILSILVLTILFTLHLDAFISFFVSFISQPVYSLIIPGAIMFENLPGQLLRSLDNTSWLKIKLILGTFTPFGPIRLFSNGNSNSTMGGVSQENHIIFLEQIFWTVALKMFSVWFEEVCPWQKVSAKRSPLFCLKPHTDRFSSSSDFEVIEQTGDYFEPLDSRGREAGIKVQSITKSYGNLPAVSNLSFTVFKGETTFLLGHNGAGKSTLIDMILGVLTPDKGRVFIKTGTSRGSIGVCPQTSILDDDLTVTQHLELFNDIKSDIGGTHRSHHIQTTLQDISLLEHKNKRPTELSGGMRRKLSLGLAFIGKSEVLLLDEPSSGLDPDSRIYIWDVIRKYRTDRTVLLSTQHMEEADYLGDRIAIMSSGRLICCGSSVFLKNLFGTAYKLRIETKPGKREKILEHIRHHFQLARLVSESGEQQDQNQSDFIVELKNSENEDPELAMIKLLENLENSREALGVRSYGLKSSSIEDVMIHTSKYLGQGVSDDTIRVPVASTRDHLEIIVKSKLTSSHESRLSLSLRVLRALVIKQFQVFRSHWLLVLFIKILIPLSTAYDLINALETGVLRFSGLWMNPLMGSLIAHVVYFPLKERISKFKTIQLESDATIWLYWLSQVVIDLLSVILLIVSLMVFLSYSVEDKLRITGNPTQIYLIISIATFIFSLAGMAFCYVLSTILEDSRMVYVTVCFIMAIGSLINFIVYIARLALFETSTSQWLSDTVSYLAVLFMPADSYRLLYVGFTEECYVTRQESACPTRSTSISLVSLSIAMMVLQAISYSVLLVMIESQKVDLNRYLSYRNIISFCRGARLDSLETNMSQLDDDVVKESERAQVDIDNPNDRVHCMTASKLDKSYLVGKRIIKELSFSLNKAECFGLLGVNGAGKSTTFSMLVGELFPDSGRLLANGAYFHRDLQKYRRVFGYDPQFSPDLSLTVHQALWLMARLRAVDEPNIRALIEAVLDLLSMTEHAHKLDSQLSGGTKRKLALGMALIGNPAILALDEPTAGVDPLARRGIWRLLRSLKIHNGASIIISSHAMEECEAICDRISIMARGRLRCIGTFLHLLSKFARGCSLRVQYHRKPDSPAGPNQFSDQLVEEVTRRLGDSIGPTTFKMVDRNVNSITLDILDHRVRRSLLFRTMRDLRLQNSNFTYMINDSSLEDIFVSLAKEQQELERRATPQP